MSESNTPVTADESPPPAQGADTRSDVRRPGGTALPLIVAVLALGLSIGLAVTAYFTWHQVQQLIAEQAGIEAGVSDRIQPLRGSLDGVDRALREERARVDASISSLNADQQSVGHRLNVLAALMGRSERGWTLAEVEYLLRIANQRLQLQRDLNTARQALLAADERLRDLADPHYLSVREQIARDLDAVGAVPVVDVDGLSAKLGAALQVVDDLPVAGTRYQPTVHTKAAGLETEKTAGTLEELPTLVWSSLSELFRLREHEQSVGPMLPPQVEYFLRENLRLQLAAARLALLRNDREQYRAALDTAGDWLQVYFDSQDNAVQKLVEKLGSMSTVDITPPVPDVSASLRLLRQQLKLTEEAEVLPVVPEHLPEESQPEPALEDGKDAAEAPL